VLIERNRLARYLREVGAADIQRDACDRLCRPPQRLGEPFLTVRVVNHTPELDGSVRELWLRVQHIRTLLLECPCQDMVLGVSGH